jgi:hypothetical protein
VEEAAVEVGTLRQRRVRLRMEVRVAAAVAVEEAIGVVRGKTEVLILEEGAVDFIRV